MRKKIFIYDPNTFFLLNFDIFTSQMKRDIIRIKWKINNNTVLPDKMSSKTFKLFYRIF